MKFDPNVSERADNHMLNRLFISLLLILLDSQRMSAHAFSYYVRIRYPEPVRLSESHLYIWFRMKIP